MNERDLDDTVLSIFYSLLAMNYPHNILNGLIQNLREE